MWFDPAVVEAVQNLFPEWTAYLFALLSYLGSIWFVAPVAVAAYWFGDRYRFGPWLATAIGTYAVMIGLKELFFIPRPGVGPVIAPEALPTAVALLYAPAVEVGTTTFPSGHALAATVVWTMLAVETDAGTLRGRLAGAATVILLVGFSRIAVGLHYPIDVVAGISVGIAYLLALGAVLRRATGDDLLGGDGPPPSAGSRARRGDPGPGRRAASVGPPSAWPPSASSRASSSSPTAASSARWWDWPRARSSSACRH